MKLKPSLIKRLLSFVITILFISKSAFAFVPTVNKAPKPTWIVPCKSYNKRPSDRDLKDGAYDELVEEQINVEAKATYNHIITQIVSASGVQDNSDISVSFDPSYEHLDFHEIIVWRNNKPTSRLNIDAFKVLAQENELEKFIYNGTYSAKLILSDIRKGDKIDYSYTITGRNPIFNNKFCRSIYLQGSNLIEHQLTTLLFSPNRKLNMKSYNLISQPQISESGGLKRYVWEDFQVPGISSKDNEPNWYNLYAHVQVSEFSNWEEVINWGLSINPIKTNFSGELADTIASFKRQFKNNKENYFRAAVRLVQDEVRYMGIETGEYSHKANEPIKVFQKRYGDCKDKSLLLASILNADGIEAHMALINTTDDDKIESYLPSNLLFNHAVVVANVNGKQVWVDATISNQGGKWTDIYFPPYGDGLILKQGNTGLTKIKESKAGKVICEEKYEIKDEYSPVKFTVKTTYTLNHADNERDNIASDGRATTEKNYLDYYSKIFTKIKATDSLIVTDNKDINEFTTIETYTINDFFKRDTAEKKFHADFYIDYISNQLPKISGQSNYPVAVNYPNNIDYTINITMPNGWDITNEHYELNREAYQLKTDQIISDDKLSLHYQFAYLKKYVSQDNLPQFKQDIKDFKDDKLYFSFYYTPNIKIVPFHLNKLMILLTAIVAGLFVYAGFTIYTIQTREANFYNQQYTSPPIGGWLIVLIIVLCATPLNFIKTLVDGRYFSMSEWDFITVGVGSILNRALLIFETIGYVSFTCYSIFCIVLVAKKRDITTHTLKIYYISMVSFLFIDYFFNGYVNGKFSNYEGEQILKSVLVAACWTYYLNTSTRVRSTFIIPYTK